MRKHIYIASCTVNGGIYHYIFNGESITLAEKVLLDRPMYMIIRQSKMYVLLREIDTKTHFGGLIVFDIDNKGRLVNPTDIVNTKGIVPCHLEATEKGVYVVNYLSGNIVKLPEKIISHKGRGFDKIRQESPHTHFTMRSPDKKNILCTDLGLDTLFLYDEDLNKKFSVNVPNGKGIRHICFSEDGKYFYSVNELSNDVSVFYYNGGKPLLKGTYSAIPDFKGKSTAAAIRIKEDNLYISNRGADTISRFKICKEELILLENTPCGGKSPRDFDFVGDYIFCTNEKTNNLTVLKLENRKPLLTDISADVESPVCISTI